MAVEVITPTPRGDEPVIEVPKKKIAGKFDTLEQAVEEGYMGLEKGFHSLSETVGKLTKVMEAALTAPAPIGSNNQNADPYGRNQPIANDDDIDPAKFLINPGEILRKRDDKLASRIISGVVDLVGNMNAVNQFKADNPDLQKHEKIVQAFMTDTDKRLSTSDRLKEAGKQAREYLKSLKVDMNAGNPNQTPIGDGYVEGPSSTPIRGPVATPKEDQEGEADLMEYINERHRNMSSHFEAPPEKK